MQQVNTFETEDGEISSFDNKLEGDKEKNSRRKWITCVAISLVAVFTIFAIFSSEDTVKHRKKAASNKSHQKNEAAINKLHDAAAKAIEALNASPPSVTRDGAYNRILQLVKIKQGNSNFIFSPVSLELAMALLTEGLEDDVKKTVSQKLGFDLETVYSPQRLDAINTKLSQTKDTEQEKFSLTTSNSLWIKEGLKLNPKYQSALQIKYKAASNIEKLDTEETRRKINQWISDSTGKMIPEFLKQTLSRDSILVLINALYFQASWMTPFKDYFTQKAQFKSIDRTKKEVDLMFLSSHLDYFEDETY